MVFLKEQQAFLSYGARSDKSASPFSSLSLFLRKARPANLNSFNIMNRKRVELSIAPSHLQK